MQDRTKSPNLRQASREAERRFVACLWFRREAVNAACDVGLTGRDFYLAGHSAVFAYACTKHLQERRPDLAECVRLAHEAGVSIDEDELFALIMEHKKADDPLELARAVKVLSRERSDEDCRAVCRDALRSGLLTDYIEWRHRRARRPYHHV